MTRIAAAALDLFRSFKLVVWAVALGLESWRCGLVPQAPCTLIAICVRNKIFVMVDVGWTDEFHFLRQAPSRFLGTTAFDVDVSIDRDLTTSALGPEVPGVCAIIVMYIRDE